MQLRCRRPRLRDHRRRGVRAGRPQRSITVGEAADIILIDLGDAKLAPANHPAPSMVGAGHTGNVTTVLVNGAVVKRDRNLTGVDLTVLTEQAKASLRSTLRNLGRLTRHPRDPRELPHPCAGSPRPKNGQRAGGVPSAGALLIPDQVPVDRHRAAIPILEVGVREPHRRQAGAVNRGNGNLVKRCRQVHLEVDRVAVLGRSVPSQVR